MKKYICLLISILLSSVLIFGCAKKPGDEIVLVKVGNSVITLSDFNARVSKLPAYYQNIIKNHKKRYLEEMVVEKMLFDEAVRKNLNNDPEVGDVMREAKKKIVITKLVKGEVEDKVKISEEEIRDFYDKNKDVMKSPAMWRASHILVPTEEEAREILQALNSGAGFELLAKERSKDATASRGGDVGYFRAGQLVPEFERACFDMKPGELSGVVKSDFGYHLIKLTDKKEPGIEPYESARRVIENEIRKKKLKEDFDHYIIKLKDKYNVKFEEAAFKLLDPAQDTTNSANK